ncbi:TNF receptor-associated factor 6 [Desmophyllum pertusum]|uniref:TNF receptor-associated factor 6 n=1 Tax=Desmophyllum pertusum TaxID=174260 RepID=A0A9X0CEL1_9CNID|nr:TNF receptor-associated factor 6 [Desmophyllum pertusum]
MNDPRCPVDNAPLTEAELRDDSQECVVRNNTHLVVPSTVEQRVAEHEQQSDYQQANGEQSSEPSSPDNETDQAVSQMMNGQEQQSDYLQTNGEQSIEPSSPDNETDQAVSQMTNGQEQHSGYQQTNGEQSSEPSSPDNETDQAVSQMMNGHEQHSGYQQTNGEQSSEPSSPDNETNQAVSQMMNGQEQQSDYQQANGEQSSEPSSPDNETNQAVSQRMNGQEQQSDFQQADGGQVNGLSYSVQETPNRQPYPEAGGDQACRYSCPVPGTRRRPDEHEDQPPCYQQHNGDHINAVSSLSQREEAMEHNCSRQELQLWNQKLERQASVISLHLSNSQKATRSKTNPNHTFFIEVITEVAQHRQADANGVPTAIFSCPIYTDSYEYKLGIRLYPNGVDNERGRDVAIFVNMMKGEYDDVQVRWPFTQRIIKFSILDQSGANRHISQIMQAKPTLLAFQKPTEAISRTGCGFVKFAPIEEVFSPPYVRDDKMFLKIEFSA